MEAGLCFPDWSKREFESGVSAVPALTWYVGLHGSRSATCWRQRSSTHGAEGTHKTTQALRRLLQNRPTLWGTYVHVYLTVRNNSKPVGFCRVFCCVAKIVVVSPTVILLKSSWKLLWEEPRRASLDFWIGSVPAPNNYKLWDKNEEQREQKIHPWVWKAAAPPPSPPTTPSGRPLRHVCH